MVGSQGLLPCSLQRSAPIGLQSSPFLAQGRWVAESPAQLPTQGRATSPCPQPLPLTLPLPPTGQRPRRTRGPAVGRCPEAAGAAAAAALGTRTPVAKEAATVAWGTATYWHGDGRDLYLALLPTCRIPTQEELNIATEKNSRIGHGGVRRLFDNSAKRHACHWSRGP